MEPQVMTISNTFQIRVPSGWYFSSIFLTRSIKISKLANTPGQLFWYKDEVRHIFWEPWGHPDFGRFWGQFLGFRQWESLGFQAMDTAFNVSSLLGIPNSLVYLNWILDLCAVSKTMQCNAMQCIDLPNTFTLRSANIACWKIPQQ